MGVGGIVVLMSLIVGEAFGVTSFGEIFGYIRLAWMIGNGVSPFLAGYIFDVTQGYFWAFIPGVVLIVLATIAIFFARESSRQERH